MTEEEWFTERTPDRMLDWVRGQATERKLRLFAIACCRRAAHLLSDERASGAFAIVERFVDGSALLAEIVAAQPAIGVAVRDAWRERYKAEADADFCTHPGHTAAYAVEMAVYGVGALFDQVATGLVSPSLEHGWEADGEPHEYANLANCSWAAALIQLADRTSRTKLCEIMEARVQKTEAEVQAVLLRDIFGHPFRPVAFDTAWRTSTVTALAQQMYDSREFSAMPILADALQDAGCENADILTHCRGPGPHVRGCWVVDLVLGKE